MPPKTRMDENQTARFAEIRRAAWTERTGIPLVTEAEHRARGAQLPGSVLERLLTRLLQQDHRQQATAGPRVLHQPRLPVGPSLARDLSLTAARQGRTS